MFQIRYREDCTVFSRTSLVPIAPYNPRASDLGLPNYFRDPFHPGYGIVCIGRVPNSNLDSSASLASREATNMNTVAFRGQRPLDFDYDPAADALSVPPLFRTGALPLSRAKRKAKALGWGLTSHRQLEGELTLEHKPYVHDDAGSDHAFIAHDVIYPLSYDGFPLQLVGYKTSWNDKGFSEGSVLFNTVRGSRRLYGINPTPDPTYGSITQFALSGSFEVCPSGNYFYLSGFNPDLYVDDPDDRALDITAHGHPVPGTPSKVIDRVLFHTLANAFRKVHSWSYVYGANRELPSYSHVLTRGLFGEDFSAATALLEVGHSSFLSGGRRYTRLYSECYALSLTTNDIGAGGSRNKHTWKTSRHTFYVERCLATCDKFAVPSGADMVGGAYWFYRVVPVGAWYGLQRDSQIEYIKIDDSRFVGYKPTLNPLIYSRVLTPHRGFGTDKKVVPIISLEPFYLGYDRGPEGPSDRIQPVSSTAIGYNADGVFKLGTALSDYFDNTNSLDPEGIYHWDDRNKYVAEAVEPHVEAVQSNLIESASGFRDLSGFVPPLPDTIHDRAKVYSNQTVTQAVNGTGVSTRLRTKLRPMGANALEGFLEFVKTVPELVLWWSFCVRPTYDEANQIASISQQKWDAVRGLMQSKYSFDYVKGATSSEDEYRVTLCSWLIDNELTTDLGAPRSSRSASLVFKVARHYRGTFSISDSNVARAWLTLKANGVEPSTSNLSDLIPLSFAVNWFLNVGAVLNVVDNQALYATLRMGPIGYQYTATCDDVLKPIQALVEAKLDASSSKYVVCSGDGALYGSSPYVYSLVGVCNYLRDLCGKLGGRLFYRRVSLVVPPPKVPDVSGTLNSGVLAVAGSLAVVLGTGNTSS